MESKTIEAVNNICTILGGALLLYPLINSATQVLIPEMQKLASGTVEGPAQIAPAAEEKEGRLGGLEEEPVMGNA